MTADGPSADDDGPGSAERSHDTQNVQDDRGTQDDRGIGRRGLVGMIGAATFGAVAGGAVGARLGGDGSDGGSDGSPESVDPPPAAPDVPPLSVADPIDTSDLRTRAREEPDFDPSSPLHPLYDLRVAQQIVDDFPDAEPTGERVGSAGWAVVLGGEGASTARAPDAEGGVVRLATGTSPTGRTGMHLGLESQQGFPLSTTEWRLAFRRPMGRSDLGGVVFGNVADVAGGGTAPTAGTYFLHRLDLGDTWLCCCAGAEGRTLLDTGVKVDGLFHRFKITTDGESLARFYVDDVRVASINTTIPTAEDRYGPGVEVYKSKGERPFEVDVDWFYLRRELAR